MNITGLRSKTEAWLKANPNVRPECTNFGKVGECACILGAAAQAVGVAEIDEDGFVKVGGSFAIASRAAEPLGLLAVVACDISDCFDTRVVNNPEYTWAHALKLLPE